MSDLIFLLESLRIIKISLRTKNQILEEFSIFIVLPYYTPTIVYTSFSLRVCFRLLMVYPGAAINQIKFSVIQSTSVAKLMAV